MTDQDEAREAPADLFDRPRHSSGAVKRARRLRGDMTASEKKLWAQLRKLDLHIRRQAPIGRFIVDFAHHSARLVLEVDGGVHSFPEQALRDVERDAWLQSQGYRVIRIDNRRAYEDPFRVAEEIRTLIREAIGAKRG